MSGSWGGRLFSPAIRDFPEIESYGTLKAIPIMRIYRWTIIACGFSCLCAAQSVESQPSTRVGEIERARASKESMLRPDEVSRAEKFLRDLKEKKWLERIT